MKIGILGAADIAYNRFLPSLQKTQAFSCAGVAAYRGEDPSRARRFTETYQLPVYESYEALIADPEIDAVYVPVPPAFHAHWGRQALEAGKHLLLEKPFTASLSETKELLALAEQRQLAVHENYMFGFHSQIETVKNWIQSGEHGQVRLLRAAFGFPLRQTGDFRYKKSMGGGALLDAAGYVLRLASLLLGPVELLSSNVQGLEGFEVDMQGAASLRGLENGLVYQGAWGMSHFYQCALELWTSEARLSTNRIFTAPADYEPVWIKETQGQREELRLPADDHFRKSIEQFRRLVDAPALREGARAEILRQAELVEAVRRGARQA